MDTRPYRVTLVTRPDGRPGEEILRDVLIDAYTLADAWTHAEQMFSIRQGQSVHRIVPAPVRGPSAESHERLREQFAAAALTALLADRTGLERTVGGRKRLVDALCREAWQWANTMLRERPPANPLPTRPTD